MTEYNKHDWEVAAKSILKIEMTRQNMSYKELSRRMESLGVPYSSADNLKSKINRGSFAAIFMLQVLYVLGINLVEIKNLPIRKELTKPVPRLTNQPTSKPNQ